MSYQVGILMLECCGIKSAPYKKEPTQHDFIFQHLYQHQYDEEAFFSKVFGQKSNIHKEIKTLILALIQPEPVLRENL